jgi:hypothetical protein
MNLYYLKSLKISKNILIIIILYKLNDKSLLDFYDYKNFKKYSPYRNSYQEPKISLSNHIPQGNKNKFKFILMYRYINIMKKDIHNRIIEIEKNKNLNQLVESIEKFMDMKYFYLSSSLYKSLLDNFTDKKLIYIIPLIYKILNELV